MASLRAPCPYTPAQISQYLHHISLPQTFLPDANNPQPDLKFLAALQRHHLASIPFENLGLHYSLDRQISLNPQAVYDKFITRRRGGYCMEQNMFFNHMLRGLGFNVYSAGARVRERQHGLPVGDYMGWSHMVNIVALPPADSSSGSQPQRYVVDVGFGGDGPTTPLPLTPGVVARNLGSQEVKLIYENIASNVDPEQRLWIYQIRNHETDEWKDCYCFPELEFLPQDFEVMNFFVSNSPASWFTKTVVAVKMLLDEQGENVVGKEMLLGAEVKRNMGGKTQLVKTCATEDERIEVLKDVFGLVLSEEEREGMRGSVAALPNQHSSTSVRKQ